MPILFVTAGIVIFGGIVSYAWWNWATKTQLIAQYFTGANTAIENAGIWGDSFGAFNSIFSALGFAAILSTLILQGIALKRQQDDLHLQRFEATFFDLLKMMRDARAEIEFEYSQEFLQLVPRNQLARDQQLGRNALVAAADELDYWAQIIVASGSKLDKAVMSGLYEDRVHGKSEIGLGPYFRIIYSILYRIKSDKVLTVEEKVRYGNLLRSQLNSSELALIGFNGLAPFSGDLQVYLEHFRFFKYLPQNSSRKALAQIYKPEAFLARN